MSLIVNLYYTGSNDNVRKFVEEMEKSGTAEAIRREEGNEQYEYFVPVNDSKTVLLIDRWRDQAALDRHHASPLMKEIARLRDKYDLHMKVERFIANESEMPASDAEFIKK